MIRDIDIVDLLNETRYSEPKNKFTDISQDIQQYVVVPWLMTKNGGQIEKTSGVGIKETLMVDDGGYSRFVGEYDEDVVMVGDFLTKMQLNWTLMTDNVAYSRGEILENRGDDRINNIILPRRRAMRLRIVKTMEQKFFATPVADDELSPWGLLYWVVKNSGATPGFNGGAAAGFTTVANVNLTTYPNFKNYTFTYSAVSKTDLIAKLRQAHDDTFWVSPITQSEFDGDIGKRRILLVNRETKAAMEVVGEGQNENLGRDLAPFGGSGRASASPRDFLYIDGDIVFKKHPIRTVRYLDSDTTNPVYMLDQATMHALTMKGDNMREGDYAPAPNQHRVFVSHIDHKVQFMFTNRRNNAVGYVA